MSVSVEIRRHSPDKAWTYELLDRHQRAVAERIRDQEGQGVLLLSELAPVITHGRRTEIGDFLWSQDAYEKAGVQRYATDRGGLATYHGPGQWVLFPVDRLDRLTGNARGVRKS